MKIQSSLPVPALDKVQGGAREASARKEADAERVVLSDTAQFIQSLRETVVDMPEARAEMIEAARSDLEAGILGNEADFDRAVDALLTEL
jgi:hypothetical protein